MMSRNDDGRIVETRSGRSVRDRRGDARARRAGTARPAKAGALALLSALLLAIPAQTADAGVPPRSVKWVKSRHTVQERAKYKCLWWMPGGATFWSHTVQEEIFLMPWDHRSGR